MDEPRYYQIIKDLEEQQRVIDDAHAVNTISGEEYELLMHGTEDMTNRELERALEILVRIGVFGRITTS